jgi:hypothetical protein
MLDTIVIVLLQGWICVEPHTGACSDLYIDFNLIFVLS